MNVKQWTMRALALSMAAALVVGCSDDPDPSVDAGDDVETDAELDSDPEPDTSEEDAGEDTDPEEDVDPDADGDPDADVDPQPELTDVELISEVLATGFCEAAFSCADSSYQAANLASMLSRFGSVEACIAGGEQWLAMLGFLEPIDAVADGRIVLGREGAQTCATALTSALCEDADLEGPPPACDAFLQPTRDEGDACLSSEECTGEQECRFEAETTCYGTCAAPEPPSPCGDEGICQPWEYCDDNAEPPTCVLFTAAGDECTFEGDECDEGEVCDFGFCRVPEVVAFELIAAGASCGAASEALCEPGLICGVVFDDEGQRVDEAGRVCGEPREAGAFCAGSNECLFGLYCNDEGVCAELIENGEPCESSQDCASGMCGDGVEAICVERVTCEVP